MSLRPGIAADPRYLDVSVPPNRKKTLPFETGRQGFAYVFEGSGSFRNASEPGGVLTEEGPRETTGNRSLVQFDRSDEVTVPDRDEHQGRAAPVDVHRPVTTGS